MGILVGELIVLIVLFAYFMVFFNSFRNFVLRLPIVRRIAEPISEYWNRLLSP